MMMTKRITMTMTLYFHYASVYPYVHHAFIGLSIRLFVIHLFGFFSLTVMTVTMMTMMTMMMMMMMTMMMMMMMTAMRRMEKEERKTQVVCVAPISLHRIS